VTARPELVETWLGTIEDDFGVSARGSHKRSGRCSAKLGTNLVRAAPSISRTEPAKEKQSKAGANKSENETLIRALRHVQPQ
jgi:hypothetical protein